jgi:hypothetical protein
VTKSGTSTNYDAGATSQVEITGANQGIEWTATAANKGLFVGLATVGTNSQYGYADIDYSWRLWTNGQLHAFQSSSSKGQKGMYAVGDKFQIRVNSAKKIEYVWNGLVLYTSTTAPVFPLVVDTDFYSPGASIKDFKWITSAGFAKPTVSYGATTTLKISSKWCSYDSTAKRLTFQSGVTSTSAYKYYVQPKTPGTAGCLKYGQPFYLDIDESSHKTSNCGWYGCRVGYYDGTTKYIKFGHGTTAMANEALVALGGSGCVELGAKLQLSGESAAKSGAQLKHPPLVLFGSLPSSVAGQLELELKKTRN